jgi:hypothetical protein
MAATPQVLKRALNGLNTVIDQYNKAHPARAARQARLADQIRKQVAQEKALVAACDEMANALYTRLSKGLTSEQRDLLGAYSLLKSARSFELNRQTQGLLNDYLKESKRLLAAKPSQKRRRK